MKKRTMKLVTLILAATLMLSMSITAFAATNNSCCTEEDGITVCIHPADLCDMEDCPIHSGTAKAGDENNDKDKTEGAGVADPNDAETNTDNENGGTVSGGNVSANDKETTLNADVTKDNAETIKTGETTVIPIIIGLAVITCAAGGGYYFYRKKSK